MCRLIIRTNVSACLFLCFVRESGWSPLRLRQALGPCDGVGQSSKKHKSRKCLKPTKCVCAFPSPKEARILPHAGEEKFHLPFSQDNDIYILECLRASSEYSQLQLIYQQYRHRMPLWKILAVNLEITHLAMCFPHKHQGPSQIPRQVTRWDGKCP